MEGEGWDCEGGGEVGVDFGVVFWLLYVSWVDLQYTRYIVLGMVGGCYVCMYVCT